MATRTELLRKLVKRKGVAYVLIVFTVGPIVWVWALTGQMLITIGQWMQHVVGTRYL